jgi:hypothetical protein
MQLVDEQDRVVGVPQLSMIFLRRSSNSPRYLVPATEAADVERQDPLVEQGLRHVAGDDAVREALRDRRLADAGSPINAGCSSCGARGSG